MFPPDHYRTAERFGADFGEEKYPDAEILAEIDLTLHTLLHEDPRLSMGRDDLEAYHWLHYGGMRGASNLAVSAALAGEHTAFIRGDKTAKELEPLQKVLQYVLGPDQLSMPLPLGRFPLNRFPLGTAQAHPPLPDAFMDLFEGTVPAEPIPARNPGPFLYVRDGVSLSYNGTVRTDSEFGRFVFGELTERNPSLLERTMPNADRADLDYEDRPALHLDELIAEEDGSTHTVVAISSSVMLLGVELSAGFDSEG